MKEYLIKIIFDYAIEPRPNEFDALCNRMAEEVGKICNNDAKTIQIIYPTQKDLDNRHYFYRLQITIKSENNLTSRMLFDTLNKMHALVLVNLQETRFCKQDKPVYWLHEGETTYHDGGTYISPNYDFYVNGQTYYTIQYVPLAIKNMYDHDKRRYKDVTYMWRCTGSWDNFMKATTIDEAIEEFEKYYQKMLWDAVEGRKKSLDDAINSFRNFDEYRWTKKC